MSLRSAFLIAAVVAVLTSAAFAVEAGRSTDFLITKWTTEQGLPQNTVTSIVQTSDGYIWLGTFGGLARFDGIRFTTFDATTTPNFRTNRVLSLHANPRGGLWVGTDTGEVYLINGNTLVEFESGLDFTRKAVWGIEEDGLGNLFVSSTAGIETVALDENGWPVTGSSKILTRGDGYKLFRDRNERVWAPSQGNILLLDRSGITPITSLGYSLPLGGYDLAFSDEGALFVSAWASIGEASPSRYREILAVDNSINRTGSMIAFAEGRVWFQQAHELYEINGFQIISHDLSNYVQQGTRSIFSDSEGNLWLGTETEGLIRLTRRTLGSLATELGRDLTGLFAIAQQPDGTIWFTGTHLRGMKGDNIRTVSAVSDKTPFPTIQTLAIDPDGNLFAGGRLGLYRLEGDRLRPFPALSDRHVQSLFFDKNGVLWIGTETGLVVMSDDKLSFIDEASGLPANSVHFITQTSDGVIWIGTKNGIAKVDNATLEMVRVDENLIGYFVRDILEAADGSMWIGTYGGGLKRIKDGQVSSVSRANGLPNNFISKILVADDGKFWILSNFGIFVVTLDELNRVADGSASILGGAIYSMADGMTSSEASGGHQPAGMKAMDGRLWFPMIDDLVSIDPKKIATVSPRVVIENAFSRIGKQPEINVPLSYDTSKQLEIGEGVRNLEIEYAGLSFSNPEALRYVYKLEGLDTDWIDAGNRRTAFYPYLPPGTYHFVVRALSANGVWSETASMQVRVAEYFWESRWFASMVFIVVAGLLGLVFWNRLRHLRERQERRAEFARQIIFASEQERRRIATDLHDGLSQNLLLVKNWARLAIEKSDIGQ